ncbi:MAG: 3-phosphoshikimate 1-carboxyvinyltransferase [Erysipelotrichaceae bacterium]|nr:3-phosphoshikimate 1-carboxyvinyltransferase [Erysipelotrichaceae bacterium]
MKAIIGRADNSPAEIRIPSSKSLSHRYLIAAALADGRSVIKDLADNDDIKATMDCLRKLGAENVREDDSTYVRGTGGHLNHDGSLIDCRESGSTLRFLLPLFAQSGRECIFTGKGRLMERPQTVYEDLYEMSLSEGQLRVRGQLKPGRYEIRGDISSQFITGLMLLLPLLNGDSVIEVREPFESRSYVQLTADVLAEFGIRFMFEGNTITVPGSQKYHSVTDAVSGDDSQAVFFAALAALNNRKITVLGMNHDSHQGDHQFIELFRKAGVTVKLVTGGYSFASDGFRGMKASLKDCPDLGPMLFAMACRATGDSHFTDVRRLRMKESDRIAAMEEELRKLGCEISSDENNVWITGKADLKGEAELDGHGDHRIVMALSVLASSIDGETVINGAEAVNKSYPDFFEDLRKTGVEVKLT